MEALEQLKEKLNTLLKKYAASRSENKRMTSVVDELTKKNSELTARIASMEKGLVNVRLDQVATGEDKENMRHQLDSVIEEIDQILQSLND